MTLFVSPVRTEAQTTNANADAQASVIPVSNRLFFVSDSRVLTFSARSQEIVEG